MTDSLAYAFDSEDERFDLVFWGAYKIEGDTTTYYTPQGKAFSNKFRDPENREISNHGTNTPIIRYSDVLLMAAEAINEINNGPNNEAEGYFNQVRLRSNISPISSGLSKDEFLKALQDERWKEFFGESIRWFDLQRWGILKQRVEWAKSAQSITVTMPKHKYFPFPQEEVDANENLEQNEGY